MLYMLHVSEQMTSIRFPTALWKRVRVRAVEMNKGGVEWLAHCAEWCLVHPDGRSGEGGPEVGLGAEKKEQRPGPAARPATGAEPRDPRTVLETQMAATEVFLERQRTKQRAAANARVNRGREGEDDQSPPEEWEG